MKATLGVLTSNRADILKRCLDSYLANAQQYGHTVKAVVTDDSMSQTTRAQCRAMLAAVRQETGCEILYAGLEEKLLFVRQLLNRSEAPPDVIKFALFDSLKTNLGAYGANRNALLLDTAGEQMVCVDDDTECRIAAAPRLSDELMVLEPGGTDGRDPSNVWNFPDREAALAAADFQPLDFFGTHFPMLGKTAEGRKVNITLNGLLGDCGWGGPSKYLFLTGDAFSNLTQSHDHYEEAVCCREMLRTVQQPTLADSVADLMTTVIGMDNTGLLPPFLPVARGEDIIFSQTLSACFADNGFVFLPFAVLHCPPDARAFWKGEVMRSASGIDYTILLSMLIKRFGKSGSENGAAGLRELGGFLEGLASRPQVEFDETAREAAADYVQHVTTALEKRINSGDAPAFWASDATSYIELLQAHAKDEFYSVPLDLQYGRRMDEARELTKNLTLQYGRLLRWWPEMIEITKDIKKNTAFLAKPAE